jgi:hypothetical protein
VAPTSMALTCRAEEPSTASKSCREQSQQSKLPLYSIISSARASGVGGTSSSPSHCGGHCATLEGIGSVGYTARRAATLLTLAPKLGETVLDRGLRQRPLHKRRCVPGGPEQQGLAWAVRSVDCSYEE